VPLNWERAAKKLRRGPSVRGEEVSKKRHRRVLARLHAGRPLRKENFRTQLLANAPRVIWPFKHVARGPRGSIALAAIRPFQMATVLSGLLRRPEFREGNKSSSDGVCDPWRRDGRPVTILRAIAQVVDPQWGWQTLKIRAELSLEVT